MTQSRYAVLSKSLEAARERFAAYRSECVLFAATLSRGLMEYAGWPRELVLYEPVAGEGALGPTQKIEDAMHLDPDAFWHFGLRLGVEEPKAKDAILLRVRFKKLETRYIISLFGFEDFEVAAPTPEALANRLQALVQLEDEIERRLGSLLANMQSRRAWSTLGFASLGHYAEERLGVARRTLEKRAALARALNGHAILRAAYEGGRLGLESTSMVLRALDSGRVDTQLEHQWTEHATTVTVKRLRDDLRLLGRRAAGLEPETAASGIDATLGRGIQAESDDEADGPSRSPASDRQAPARRTPAPPSGAPGRPCERRKDFLCLR